MLELQPRAGCTGSGCKYVCYLTLGGTVPHENLSFVCRLASWLVLACPGSSVLVWSLVSSSSTLIALWLIPAESGPERTSRIANEECTMSPCLLRAICCFLLLHFRRTFSRLSEIFRLHITRLIHTHHRPRRTRMTLDGGHATPDHIKPFHTTTRLVSPLQTRALHVRLSYVLSGSPSPNSRQWQPAPDRPCYRW